MQFQVSTVIMRRPGESRLGCGGTRTTQEAKRKEIALINVGQAPTRFGRAVGVEIFLAGLARTPLYQLNDSAAMALVKGILENLEDVTLAVDNEFRNLVVDKINRAETEAQQMVNCIVERRLEKEKPQEETSQAVGTESLDPPPA